MLIPILFSVIMVSLVSLVGACFIFFSSSTIKKLIFPMVAFASGSMLGAAFLHMLPEAIADIGSSRFAFAIVLVGILTFFAIERVLHWHHHHDVDCRIHPITYLVVFGDAVHNFVDGMTIASSFILGAAASGSLTLGLLATIAVIAHEIPQELGDFSILLWAGSSYRKALGYNFASALTAVAGAIFAYLSLSLLNYSSLIVAFAAGGFIYMSAVDLLPRMHEEKSNRKFMLNLLLFFLGIVVIQLLSMMMGEG